jgi:ankyrin repeat protein
MKDVLNNLPTGPKAYDYAYEEAMKRIMGHDPDSKDLAKQVLSWITCSKRPLTTTELQQAIAVEVGDTDLDEENLPQMEDMVSVCTGLVTVDEESSIIRLVHYTMQEYFERTQNHWFPNAETRITETCVIYLSFNVFKSGLCQTDDEFEKRLQLNKLYDYASHNWGHHAREASILVPEVISFLERKAQVEASSQALLAVKYSSDLEYSQRFPKEMTGLHLAAYFGVEAVVKLLLDKGANIAAADTYGSTPLHSASSSGQVDVVELLLNKGANVAAAAISGETPLHQASLRGHVDIVELLLNKGANVAAADTYGSTPLHSASSSGQVDVVRLLFEKGANVDLKADRYLRQTPLSIAAENGKEAVVKLLLATDSVEPDSKDRIGRTPMLYAAKNGNTAIVKLLLATNRVEIDSKEYYNSTPLSIAARLGYKDIVALLLTQSRGLNIRDSFGRTPLWWARRTGYPEIADLLLEKYKENGIIDQEDDLPIVSISVLSDESSGYCDVCMLSISDIDAYYYCKVCCNGLFWICKECFAMKAHCLDGSHTLVEE